MTSDSVAEDARLADAELQQAADVILAAAEAIEHAVEALHASAPVEASRIRDQTARIYEACMFRDIVGQRLTRMAGGRSADPLAQGPEASPIDQARVDAMLAGA